MSGKAQPLALDAVPDASRAAFCPYCGGPVGHLSRTARQIRMLKYPSLLSLSKRAGCSCSLLSMAERGKIGGLGRRGGNLMERLRQIVGKEYVEALVCGPWAERGMGEGKGR